jgi:hypothetical protein
MMVHTNELEKQAMAGATYLDCFRGTDRRRTEIVSFSLVSRITYSLTFFQGYDDFRYATSLWWKLDRSRGPVLAASRYRYQALFW